MGVGAKGVSSAEPKFLCVFLTVLFVFASERPQIVWTSDLSWWLLDFLRADLQFSLLYHILRCDYRYPQVIFELWGVPWAKMSVIRAGSGCCLCSFTALHDKQL